MRVLIVTSTLPRWAGDAVPAFVLEQAAALARVDPELEIELLAPHHVGAATTEVLAGVPVRRFRYAWPESLQLLAYPAILPNLRERPWLAWQVPLLIVAEFVAVLRYCRRDRRPDVIYSHWFAPQGLACGAAARVLGIPHVLTSHSADVEVVGRVPLVGPLLVRYFVGQLHALTVVSRRTEERLRAFFPAKLWPAVAARVRRLPMGIDAAALAPLPSARRAALKSEWGLADRPVLLFIGRLTTKKGLTHLLEAMALLAPRHPAAVLVVAGDGELRADLERRVAAPALASRVRLTGFVGGERKRELLALADLMVVPSIVTADGDAEGLPVALLEGLAAGLPCVATDASGADDVVTEGVEGHLVPAGDAVRLAAALDSILALDESARAAMGDRARQRGLAFDWDAIARAHAEHLFQGNIR